MNAECKMGEQRLLLCFVFLCVTLASVDALLGVGDETESFVRCAHDVNEQIVYGVQQDPNDSRGKRQSPQYQPFRMHIYYDSTVNELSSTQRSRLQNIIMPTVEFNIEAALSVIPATSPILLDRDCVDGTFQVPIGPVRQCNTQCANQTFCVLAQVPEEHLKRCEQCNGMAPNCETIGSNSPGVSNADYILYVGANPASPCGGSVLAFANLCQLESTLDRPIAGAINFCPSQFAVRSDDENIRIGIHEVVHALGFSPTAYPFFRDENGNPRTPRDQFGLPPTDATGRFVPSNTTIRTTTYPDWQTRNGPINHEVLQFVTPNVVEQARIHYNCSTIEGVELENQGGGGTRSAHFEQRILGNEGMTGVLLFNIRFSRVTFGLMEDTGWYRANYGLAEPLAWGQNTGCIIPHGSCGEWIETQQQKGATLAPYCNHLAQNPLRLGCTIDRQLVSGCNLIDYGTTPIPSEFQYFNSGPNFNATVGPRAGGSLQTTDYCPFQLPLMFVTGDSRVCNQETDLPMTNLYAETYGFGSRCVEHGRQWFQTMSGTNITSAVYGGGCYQYSCSVSMGVRIQVLGHWFQCNCEGEELILDIIGSGTRYQGSLICPSCGQLCFDGLSLCPDPEPAACYGRERFITVSVTEPFTCYQDISSSGTCENETGQTFSASDCCNGLGGGAYMQNNGSCVPCPRSVEYLLYADGGIGTIYRSNLNGSDIQQLVTGLPRPIALDFDYRQNDMYWSDVSARTISRANLDGSGVTTLVNSEISAVDGLSVDWVNGKLYWTDASLRCIEVYDVSSGIRRELLRTGLTTIPRAIVVDPANRLMYWSDWGSVAAIERASMDGEARQILHNTALVWPNGLTLDYQNQVLYWIDAFLDKIESSNVDGTNRRLIISFSSNQHPFAISLFNNILYWSDWGTNTIHSILVDGTGNRSLISGFSFPAGVEVVSESRQQLPPGQNPCAENNGGCSHLCLLSAVAADGFTCSCPDDLDLEENGKNCSGSNSSFTSAFYPFGASVGDFQLPRFLDGSSSAIFLSTPIRFFETAENILYVNTNGILSFRFRFTSSFPRPFPFFGSPLIAPFWENVDIRQFGNIFYRQTSNTTLLQRVHNELQELFPSSGNFTPTRLVIATWDRVAGFLQGSQENTFQVVIATDGQRTFVLFSYGDIEWGSANIGFNAGDNLRFFTVPGTDSRDIEEGTNVGRRGVYIFQVDQCSIRGPDNAGSGSGSGSGGVDCCSLPNPVNGRVQFPDTTVGSVATYSCFFGYILNGTRTRTCEADGEWSGDPPTCDLVDCGPLDDPENGNVFVSGTRFGSSAYYYCFTGYRLIGSSFRTCLSSGNWSGSAPICQVLAQFGLERERYSTAEGDEDLEICVELLQGNITRRTYIGIGSGTQSAQFPSDVLPLNTSILTFDIGDTQQCVSIQVVDDELLEDTESFFVSIYSASFDATVSANRSSANVLIADNEVVLVGFNAPSYTVDEGANQVQVCVRLAGTAELARPIQMRVSSSKDGTATADDDFRPVLQLLTLPVGSSSGSTRCIPVYIIDDTEPETSEEIVLTLFASDVAVVVATDGQSTTVVIQDNEDFFIRFINNTPDVEGNQVTVSFTSSMPLASATCQTRPRPDQDCTSQTAVFTGLPPNRRRPYDVIITATSMFGQSATISRQFRSGTINDCGAHLINQGVVVSGNSATVEWQGTGPDPNNRVQDFQCSLDGGAPSSCTSPHVLTQLSVGGHVLRITPQRDDCRRIITRDVSFQIE